MTKLLVVDDERAMSRGLSRAILHRRPDYSVLTALSGAEAIRVLEEQQVDLVLTDLQMSDGDGFQLLAWLIGNRPSVLALAMSAFCDDDTTARLHELGGIECLNKPFDIDALLARVAEGLAASMRGHVDNIGLPSFLQLIELEQKTCTLEVRHGVSVGKLYLRRGELIDARTDDQRGEAAAYTILGWLTVDLTIDGSCNTPEQTITKPLRALLMDAMRLRDEVGRTIRAKDKPSAPSSDPFGNNSITAQFMTLQAPPTRPLRPLPTPLGTLALAVIDRETGIVIASEAGAQVDVGELARSAHAMARQANATLAQASNGEVRIDELVVMTRSRGELLRSLPGDKQLLLLVFDAEQTNVVMARLELERWVEAYTSAP